MREASEAVTRAAAHKSSAWRRSKCPSGIQPMTTAATEARNPTTIAWHCVGQRHIGILGTGHVKVSILADITMS